MILDLEPLKRTIIQKIENQDFNFNESEVVMIDIDEELQSVFVSAHVKEYNIASQKMFESSGFIKRDEYSSKDEFFYEYKQKIKVI